MRYLADENIEYPIILRLRENKVDLLAVREFMKGADDGEIIQYALINKLYIITSDKDFGELTFRLHKPSCGIILIRYPDADNIEKTEILLKAIKKINAVDSFNKFVVIDKYKIRIRSM